jgi:hypothetical protein
MNKEAFDLLLSMVDTRTGKLSADRYYGGGGRTHNAPKPTAAATLTNNFAQGVGPAYGQAARSVGNAAASAGSAVGNAASGIAGGIAGGARAVGSGVAGAARQDAASLNNSIQSARAGVRSAQQATRAATDPARSAVSTMADVTRGNTPIATTTRPPAPASTYAGPTSSQFPSPPPQPPQYFSVNRPQAPGPMQGPGMRGSVTSFDQLPPEFQARFRERLASGSVQGANEQDAVASYNRHYAGTANQLRALSQQPRTAYGSLGRADRGLSQSASLGRLRSQA